MMNNQIKKAPISIIAVLSEKDRAIGENDKLLWSIPEDLKRFKLLTSGNPVIMGRKTFESIIRYLKKPLPDRINIIVTRNLHFNYDHDDVIIANSLEQALERARALSPKEIFIIGGGEIYKQAISFTDQLYLTLVDEQKKADSFFPPYKNIFTKKTFEEKHATEEGLGYTFVNLKK